MSGLNCSLTGLCDGYLLGTHLAEDKTQLDCPVLDESKTMYESGERQCSEFACDLDGQCEGTVVDVFISRSKEKYFFLSEFVM